MNWIADAWLWLLAMGVLILLSALFSGSEAALFSIHQRGRRRLARRGTGGRIAADLLRDPERLLAAILFWNLLINMTYFAIASIVGARLQADEQAGQSTAVVFTVASLLTIIFFSEMLPKSVAVLAPVQLSVLVGVPLELAVRLVGPILPLVRVTNLAASRLIWPTFEPEPEIDLADIERAIELGTDDAVLLQRERVAMRGLVEIAATRVGELMRPRSKLRLCPKHPDRRVIEAGMPPGGYLMITDAHGMITDAIGVRMLRPSQLDDLGGAAEPVIYVPWSALASQVLDLLTEEDRSVAVVVNEFGEVVGALSIDDILRRVLAPRRGNDETLGEAAIQELGPDHFRVAGSASVRNLSKRLGVEVPDERSVTVTGFIQHHNERLPRVGDEAPLDRFRLEVVEEGPEGIWIDVSVREPLDGEAD
ncbi:MAG: CNNM domain-containing protein [Pirellulales bacterium]|nr:CNNM domain-containing protein [Pirellulales bacterium]